MKIQALTTVMALCATLSIAGCGNAGKTAGYAGNDVVNGVQRGAETVGNAAGRIGNDVGHGLRRGANAVGNAAGDIGNNVGQGLRRGANATGNAAGNVGNTVGRGIRGTANAVGNAAGAAGNAVGTAGQGVVNTTRRGANIMGDRPGNWGTSAAGAVPRSGAAAGAPLGDGRTNAPAPGQSVQVDGATKTVHVWLSDVNNRRAGTGMGLMGRHNALATGMTISIPRGWTVRVTTADSNMGALAVVPYSGRPGNFGNNTAGANTSATTIPKTGGANHQATVFHANSAGQYAIITSGSAVQNNVWDVITVTNSTTLPSISSSYTS